MWLMSLAARRNPVRLAEKSGGLELKDEDKTAFDTPQPIPGIFRKRGLSALRRETGQDFRATM
jgi:hypothetical protein